jgi:hypothetical protein
MFVFSTEVCLAMTIIAVLSFGIGFVQELKKRRRKRDGSKL